MRLASLRLASVALLLSLGLMIAGCGGSSPTPTVTISGGSTTTAIDQGQAVTFTVTVAGDSNSAGVTWTLSGVGALSGQTTTSVTYTAPSSVTSTSTVTITATSIATPSISSTRTITITGIPAISSSTLPAGTVGVAYSQALAVTGGAGTLTWTVNSGTLPTGIALSSAGVLAGTVTSPSTTVLTFKVTDASTATPLSATSSNITLTFNPVTLAVTAPTLPNAIQGTAYTSGTATSTGGTGAVTWTASGLPAGLSINSSTGVISGTPTGSGVSSSVIVTATDSGAGAFNQVKSTSALSLTVIPTLTVGSLSTVNAFQGVTAVNVTAPAVTGGVSPYTFTLSGAPAGISADASGNITGTPTASSGSPYTVTLTVKDSGTPQQTKTSSFTLNVAPALVVTPPTLANAIQGTAYTSSAYTSTGGTGAITWSATGLPAGLSINSSTGVISGTPTGSGVSSSVVVTATDAGVGPLNQVKSTTAVSLTVIPTLTAGSLSNASAIQGVTNLNITAPAVSGGVTPYTFTLSGAPAGVSADASGKITGTPTAASGSPYTVTLTVKDAGTPQQTKTSSFTLTVAPTLVVTPPTLTNAIQGTAYTSSAYTSTGGTGSITWSATGLPAGLSIGASTGIIGGTPTGSGVSGSVVITATDAGTGPLAQVKSTSAVSLTVIPTLTVGSLSNTSAVQGVTNLNITAPAVSGGVSGYTFTLSGAPAGVTADASGNISGTPTAASGSPYSVVLTVKDSGTPQQTKTASFTLTVAPTLVITPPALGNAIQGSAYTSAAFTSTGGTGSITWSATGLPAGLSIGASTGIITGTPTGSGTSSSVIVTATDSGVGPLNQVKSTTSLTLNVNPTLAITTSSLPTQVLGTTYNPAGGPLAATGGFGTLSWSATGLPLGLSVNPSTGGISGALSGAITGPFSVVISVHDSGNPLQTKSTTLTMTVNPGTPVITTVSLPAGSVGIAYSQTLNYNAEGQVGAPTWAVTAGSVSMSNVGLSLNPATGVVSAASPTAGTANFTVTVTVNSLTSATQSYSVLFTTGPIVTVTTLPPAYVGTSYSQTLGATGGTGGYHNWAVTSGSSTLSAIGLSLSSGGVLSGTPTATGNGSFAVTVQDSANATSSPATFNIGAYNPLSLPAANPVSLPAATTTAGYTGSITAIGGVGPNYVWTVNGTQLSNGTPLALTGPPTGLSVTTSGNGTLNVTGTPAATGTVSLNVSVKDGANTIVGPTTYTISVSNTYSITGTITRTNPCSGNSNLSGVTVTLGGASSATTTTNGSGSYTFAGLTAGTYTVTPTFPGATSAVFYPSATQTVVITSSPKSAGFLATLGYTVSGTVNYSGSKTGPIYLLLNNSNCGSGGGGSLVQGTSISAKGAFTIRGVSPGTYTLQGFMDNLGNGTQNAANPVGTATGIIVTNADLSGGAINLIDPSAVTLSSAPEFQGVAGFSGGALVLYKGLSSNNIETATSYTVEWSTNSGFATTTGTKTFPARGGHDSSPLFITGLTNGTPYYFRMYAANGTSTSPSVIYNNSGTPIAVTPNVPTGNETVSGTITFGAPGTHAAGPLYIGFVDQDHGAYYGTSIANAVSPQAYTAQVQDGTNYFFVAIVDQDNNGAISAGDFQNTQSDNVVTVISPTTTTQNLVLPTGNAAVDLTTQVFHSTNSIGGTFVNTSYSLQFKLDGVVKIPVSVAVTSGPSVISPMDIGVCTDCGKKFNFQLNRNGSAINVGDAYGLLVTYSDGTSETLTPTVSTVLSAGATALTPSGTAYTQPSGTRTTPLITWTDPVNASNYTYQFFMGPQSGSSNIWQVPGNNSDASGFASSITSLTWGVDPNDGSNTAPALTSSTIYLWNITNTDSAGNSYVQQVQYQP